MYGCTEAGAVTLNLDDDPRATATSAGRPLQGVEVAIVDDAGEELEVGRNGEVVIRSPAMSAGYAGMDELNREVFREAGFLSGDRGRIDEEGRLFITGRKKLLIDVKGDKVDPIEVEDVLAVHPKVDEVVVVGVPSDVAGEELIKAVVVAAARVWGARADPLLPRAPRRLQGAPACRVSRGDPAQSGRKGAPEVLGRVTPGVGSLVPASMTGMPDMRPDAPRYLREQDAPEPDADARSTVDVTELLSRLSERTEELAEAKVKQKAAEADLRRKSRQLSTQRKAHDETSERLETDRRELEQERDQVVAERRELEAEVARELEARAELEAELEETQERVAALQRRLQTVLDRAPADRRPSLKSGAGGTGAGPESLTCPRLRPRPRSPAPSSACRTRCRRCGS